MPIHTRDTKKSPDAHAMRLDLIKAAEHRRRHGVKRAPEGTAAGVLDQKWLRLRRGVSL